MKNGLVLSFVFAILFSFNLSAQDHMLSGGVGGGVSKLTGDLGDGGSFGINYLVHGEYYLTDKLSAGIEYNASAIGLASEESFFGVSAYGNTLVLATGNFYFTDMETKVRPYVGIGLGASIVATPEITIGSEVVESDKKTNFGISPRAGIKFGNIGLSFSYNIAGKTPIADQINVAISDKAFNFWTIGLSYDYPFEL